jgi:signal transduction histidine kinase
VGQGTGLGLWVSYGIIQGFRGDITVESEPGAGTTFSVILPYTPEELPHG